MLVTLSGIDGSGKSTLAERIIYHLGQKNNIAYLLKPKYYGNQIVRKFCHDKFGNEFLYIPKLKSDFYISALMLDWLDFSENILAKTDKNSIFVCDRYIYDVFAQAIHYNANLELIDMFPAYFLEPDLSFYLDIDPTIAHTRLLERVDPAIHHMESLENLKILYNSYLDVKKYLNWYPEDVDADSDLDLIADNISTKIINMIKSN